MIYLVEHKNVARTVQAIVSANSEIEAKMIALANYKFDNIIVNDISATELNNETQAGIILVK